MSHAPADLDVEVAAWLVGTEGLAAIAAVTTELDRGADELQVITRRRRQGLEGPRAAAVVGAAVARRRAARRWPDADQLVFTRSGLEQASDPAVSAWRARRFAGSARVEDRAAGCGGDTLALAEIGARVTAVDTDAGRLVLLAHNAAVRGVEVETVVADALTHPPPAHGPVHVDPGRRVGERRVRRLADHQPSVPALVDHVGEVARGPGLAVVLGPGLDLADPDLPSGIELEFVQLGRHLVEAVAWAGALRRAGADHTATILPDPSAGTSEPPLTRSRSSRGPRLAVGPIGDWLLEIAPAAVRARLHDELGAEVGARRIATRRALLTLDEQPPPSPWWQAREVEAVLPAGARAVRRWLRTVDELPVEVVLHGVDVDPVAYRRDLGSPPTGPSGRRIELVRGDAGAVAVATRTPRTVT